MLKDNIEPNELANETEILSDDDNNIDRGSKIKATPQKPSFDPLTIDVYGTPRTQKVPLPNAIKMTKPGAIPNERFLKIEAETKRPIKTVSTVPFQKKGGKLFSFTFSFVCIGNF
jgi:hypothetical protein